MIGRILYAAHVAFQALTSPFRARPLDPFAVLQGAFDALEQKATDRRDMRALGQIREARKVVAREAIHP